MFIVSWQTVVTNFWSGTCDDIYLVPVINHFRIDRFCKFITLEHYDIRRIDKIIVSTEVNLPIFILMAVLVVEFIFHCFQTRKKRRAAA